MNFVRHEKVVIPGNTLSALFRLGIVSGVLGSWVGGSISDEVRA